MNECARMAAMIGAAALTAGLVAGCGSPTATTDPVARPPSPTTAPPAESTQVKGMLTGTVRYFDTMRGVGSIAPDGGGPELFVHFTDIRMEGFKVLREGQKVSYVVEMGSRGPQATNVRPLDG